MRSTAAGVSDGLELNRPAIRATLQLVKFCDNWSIKNIREAETLCCGMFKHGKASFLVRNCLDNSFFHEEAFCVSEYTVFSVEEGTRCLTPGLLQFDAPRRGTSSSGTDSRFLEVYRLWM
jgi:hypothetical protein